MAEPATIPEVKVTKEVWPVDCEEVSINAPELTVETRMQYDGVWSVWFRANVPHGVIHISWSKGESETKKEWYGSARFMGHSDFVNVVLPADAKVATMAYWTLDGVRYGMGLIKPTIAMSADGGHTPLKYIVDAFTATKTALSTGDTLTEADATASTPAVPVVTPLPLS